MIKQNAHLTNDITEQRRKEATWDKICSTVYNEILILNRVYNFPISDEEIKDISQDACVKVFLNIGQYDKTKAKFKTWIVTIAENCFKDAVKRKSTRDKTLTYFHFKKQKENDQVIESLPDYLEARTPDDPQIEDFEHLLSLVLEPLCENYRTAVNCIVDGVTQEEIAEQLHCSKNNIRPTISRARKAARKSCISLGLNQF